MDYDELNNLLNSLLNSENFPSSINYHSDKIKYNRRSKFLIISKALYRLALAEIFYFIYIRKRFYNLKKSNGFYNTLKETGCIKSMRMYLHLSKIGMNDLLSHLGGDFDNKLFANFTIATTLYDAVFDIPELRKYLKNLDDVISYGKRIDSKDEYIKLFSTTAGTLKARRKRLLKLEVKNCKG